MASLPDAIAATNPSCPGKGVILARLVAGLTQEAWEEITREESFRQWLAFPVSLPPDGSQEGESLQVESPLPVTPFREVRGALTKTMFTNLLKRELLRLSRNNGSLSLVAATIANRRQVTAALGEAACAKLDALLGETLLDKLDSCDALGLTRKGVFVCSLPGLGQLAARHFAESSREAFEEASRPYFPAGGLGAGQSCSCAIGIVNIMHGEACQASDLLKRARTALDAALLKPGGNIHQEAPLAPFEGTTLVHSSEKRFLFFGGDPE